MIDRRQILFGSLAGLIAPGLVAAQPGPGPAGPPPPAPAGGTAGRPPANAGAQGNVSLQGDRLGSRLGDRREGSRDTQSGQAQEGQQASQPPRIKALILSQSYRGSPGLTLANTTRDAALMARSFQQLRFDAVTTHSDGSAALTMAHLAAYLRTIDANTVALLYVAGHGVEIGGENLLLLEDGTSFLSLQALVQLLQQRAGVTILFLDACRNNPFGNVAAAVSGRRVVRAVWLEPEEEVRIQTVRLDELRAAPNETLGRLRAFSLQGSGIKIVFSTDPANVALDGVRPNSRNSPFAEALARHIRQPVSLDDIVALTTGDVIRATRRVQSPWSQGSIDRPIFLSGRGRRRQAAFG
ncbi:MAG TPA: caspase family protein [Allosphingosinicella sp.]|jgi:uncharacterized caspase-like protein|nr:caspase family protein [Allosphingosinicella sp.]